MRKTPLILAALAIVVSVSPFCPAAAEPATLPDAIPALRNAPEYKYVWIVDAHIGLPFCRLYLPKNWRVEGNVVWNPSSSVNTNFMWLRVSDPEQGVTTELLQPVSFFFWDESRAQRLGINDGDRDANSMFYNLRPRDAEEILREMGAPLLARLRPDAVPAESIPADPARSGWADKAQTFLEEKARSEGVTVKRSKCGAAALEFVDGSSRIRLAAGVNHHVVADRKGNESDSWQIDHVSFTSMPGVEGSTEFPDPKVGDLLLNPAWLETLTMNNPSGAVDFAPLLGKGEDNMLHLDERDVQPLHIAILGDGVLSTITVNPAWRQKANALRQSIMLRHSNSPVMFNTGEELRKKLETTRGSGRIFEVSESALDAKTVAPAVYSDPENAVYQENRTTVYGFVNCFLEAAVLSGSTSNLTRLESWNPPPRQ